MAGGSLTMEAGKLFQRSVSDGGVAIIVSGFPILPWLFGEGSLCETDGPPGQLFWQGHWIGAWAQYQ